MEKKYKFFIAVLIIVLASALVLRLVGSNEDGWICQYGKWIKHGNPSTSQPTTECSTSTTPNPTTTPTNEPPVSQQPNIIITSPTASTTVNEIFTIAGLARVFENTLSVRLLNADGSKVFEKTIMADAPDTGQYGPYTLMVDLKDYPTAKAGSLAIEALQYSAKDGSETDKVRIYVQYAPVANEKIKLNVFFTNDILDPKATCNKVFAVEREVPKTVAVAQAVLTELLKGPTVFEKNQGYKTNLNPDVKLEKVVVENGIAKAEFSEELDKGVAGSCRVTAIRAQITQTLKQFPTVKDVVISINGRTEDILQP